MVPQGEAFAVSSGIMRETRRVPHMYSNGHPTNPQGSSWFECSPAQEAPRKAESCSRRRCFCKSSSDQGESTGPSTVHKRQEGGTCVETAGIEAPSRTYEVRHRKAPWRSGSAAEATRLLPPCANGDQICHWCKSSELYHSQRTSIEVDGTQALRRSCQFCKEGGRSCPSSGLYSESHPTNR